MELLSGRYRLVSRLGAGGMGEVMLAEDTQLERRVAIKFIHAESGQDVVARERLRREALVAAALDHPFICKVHEIGESDGRLFIVMEYIEGETLQAAAGRGLLPARQVIEMANELAQALEEAHRRGVVHRDLKPSNVMVTKQGHIKVMDFGLAKQTRFESSASSAAPSAATVLTGSGIRIGTPAYMSPEQVVGGTMDSQSDIFSFGIILHELASGSHPFVVSGDPAETMTAILRDTPRSGQRSLSNVAGLDTTLRRMLAKSPAERFRTMSELRIELEAARDRLLRGAALEQPTLGAATSQDRTPFVGRDSESLELKRLLDRMLIGEGGFALIGGEPGVGKTRLARELLRVAESRGCLCLTGHCYEMEGAPPFNPFIETAEQAVRFAFQTVREAMGGVAAEISIIVPSLRRAYTDIGAVPDLPPEQQRRLVFSAYLDYIRRLAQKSPCVLLLDDLHWADEPSLQLIQFIAGNLASMRVLIVGTYRDVELDVNRPFAKTLETLLRQRLAARISLRRLSESGVQQMLSAMGGSVPPSGLTKAVFRETEGNPFFVEEVYQHLAEEGRLFDDSGSWKADLRVGTIDVPEGVRLVIGRRLERLGEQARKILTAAAVIGRSFPLDLLYASVDAGEEQVLDALEEAERAQLLAPVTDQRTARYAFVHELIRTTLANSLSMPRRQRMHLKIADAIERLRAASLESHASLLAHHLYQSGAAADPQRTAKFLMLACRRAVLAGAFEETLEILDQLIGLELSEDDPVLAEAFEHRGAALTGVQKPDEGSAALERAFSLNIGRRDDEAIVRVAGALGASYVFRGRFPDAREAANRALKALSSDAVSDRAKVIAWLTPITLNLEPVDVAWSYLEQASAIAEEVNDSWLTAQVLHAKTIAHGMCMECEAAIQAGLRALPLMREQEIRRRADLIMNVALASLGAGRLTDFDAMVREVMSLATRAGFHGAIVLMRWAASLIELARTGNLRAYSENVSAAVNAAPFVSQFLVPLAAAKLRLGEIEDAMQVLRKANSAPLLSLVWKGYDEATLFAAECLTARTVDARKRWVRVEPCLPVMGQRNVLGAWWTLDASVTGLAMLQERERCGALYPLCETYAKQAVVMQFGLGTGNAQATAGIAAHAAGYRDRAREHFELAIRQAHEMPDRLLQPTARYWYGRMLLEDSSADERSRGRAILEAAESDFGALGMIVYAGLTRDLISK